MIKQQISNATKSRFLHSVLFAPALPFGKDHKDKTTIDAGNDGWEELVGIVGSICRRNGAE
ncbi:MAG: hypothetical protein Q9P14_13915 [candidate division KSB1 bacterium]|nr:hypothetical protein [candidate division KSB1 bacterium]